MDQTPSDHRIVSLIASATEIVCALGFEEHLVGRSHECDFPESVKRLPVCTAPKFDVHGSSSEIDQRVKAVLQDATSVYRVHVDVLKALRPDVIITQSQWMTWDQLRGRDPDVIVALPCGLDLERTRAEMAALTAKPGWPGLGAVRAERVYVTDGNQFFNRPGPRVVESLEILAEILHP